MESLIAVYQKTDDDGNSSYYSEGVPVLLRNAPLDAHWMVKPSLIMSEADFLNWLQGVRDGPRRRGGAIEIPEFRWDNYQWHRFRYDRGFAEWVVKKVWEAWHWRDVDPGDPFMRRVFRDRLETVDLPDIRDERSCFSMDSLLLWRRVIANDWVFDVVMMYYINLYFCKITSEGKMMVAEQWWHNKHRHVKLFEEKSFLQRMRTFNLTLPNYDKMVEVRRQKVTKSNGYPNIKPAMPFVQNVGKLWLDSYGSYTEHQLVLVPVPDQDQPSRPPTPEVLGYNLWCGMNVTYKDALYANDQEEPGATEEQRQEALEIVKWYFDHMREIICGNDLRIYRHTKAWLSRIVQRPDLRTNMCFVLCGEEGLGKNAVFSVVRAIIGKEHSIEVYAEDLNSNWNSIIANKVLVIADETDKRTENVSKNKRSITANEILVNAKYKDTYLIDNWSNKVELTNDDKWPKRLLATDRRNFVVNCSETAAGRRAWDRLAEMAVETCPRLAGKDPRKLTNAEVATHYFIPKLSRLFPDGHTVTLALKLIAYEFYRFNSWGPAGATAVDWNPCQFPDTKIRRVCIINSQDAVTQWWFNCLSRGYHVVPEAQFQLPAGVAMAHKWMVEVCKEKFWNQFTADSSTDKKHKGWHEQGQFKQAYFWPTINKLLGSQSVELRPTTHNSLDRIKITLPDLPTCKQLFARMCNVASTSAQEFYDMFGWSAVRVVPGLSMDPVASDEDGPAVPAPAPPLWNGDNSLEQALWEQANNTRAPDQTVELRQLQILRETYDKLLESCRTARARDDNLLANMIDAMQNLPPPPPPAPAPRPRPRPPPAVSNRLELAEMELRRERERQEAVRSRPPPPPKKFKRLTKKRSNPFFDEEAGMDDGDEPSLDNDIYSMDIMRTPQSGDDLFLDEDEESLRTMDAEESDDDDENDDE